MNHWIFTRHARQRAAEMGVPEGLVLAVLQDPEVDRLSGGHYGPNQRIATKGRLAVVYNVVEHVVITVLWKTQEQYRRPEKVR